MRGSYLNFSIFNTIGSLYDTKTEKSTIEVPSLLEKRSLQIEKHKERIKKFMEAYTEEILTRKDFRLLNNIFNNDEIGEQELNKMQVIGDGLEHIDQENNEDQIDHNLDNQNDKRIEDQNENNFDEHQDNDKNAQDESLGDVAEEDQNMSNFKTDHKDTFEHLPTINRQKAHQIKHHQF